MDQIQRITQPPRPDPLDSVVERQDALIRDLDANPPDACASGLDVDSGFRAAVVPSIMEGHRAADRLSPQTQVLRKPVILAI